MCGLRNPQMLAFVLPFISVQIHMMSFFLQVQVLCKNLTHFNAECTGCEHRVYDYSLCCTKLSAQPCTQWVLNKCLLS